MGDQDKLEEMDEQDELDEADAFVPYGGTQFTLKQLEIETADPDPFGATSMLRTNPYVKHRPSWTQRLRNWFSRHRFLRTED